MREFIDNFDSVDYKLVDVEGKEHFLKSRPLTLRQQEELKKILDDIQTENKKKKKNEESMYTLSYVLTLQMSYIFGGEQEQYKCFSDKLLEAVLNDWRSTKINPTVPQKENGESKN